jgi:hypothetical protein
VTTSPTPDEAADEVDRRRWRALHEWAAARTADRDDWDEVKLLGVMHGCKNAGVTYDEIEPVLWRIATTADDHQDYAELRQLAREHARKTAADPDAYARGGRLWREMYETRSSAVPSPRPAPEDNGNEEDQ